MKLSTTSDIAAPRDDVFATLSDLDETAAILRRRGAEVIRLDDEHQGPAAAEWEIGFTFRDQRRNARTRIVTCDPPARIAARADLEGLSGLIAIDLVALDPGRTRLILDLDLRAETFRGRLLLQSLKLARPSLTRRLEAGIETLAARMEARGA